MNWIHNVPCDCCDQQFNPRNEEYLLIGDKWVCSNCSLDDCAEIAENLEISEREVLIAAGFEVEL